MYANVYVNFMTESLLRPEQSVPPKDIFYENRQNGHGIDYFVPSQARQITREVMTDLDGTTFLEVPEVMRSLVGSKSVLIEGEPGSGKSHLVEDLKMVCATNGVPYFSLALHINGGKRAGPQIARESLAEFKSLLAQRDPTATPIVILDNVDYLGYRGSSRSRTRTDEFAREMAGLINELMADESLLVLGSAHDDDWREGRWAWGGEINAVSQHVVESFAARLSFEGSLSLMGLIDVVRNRHPDYVGGRAIRLVRLLKTMGLASYFYAKHTDLDSLEADPDAELARVQAGRAERKHRR